MLRHEADVPSRLFGLSLSEAFRKFVLDDPEISALGKLIVEQERGHGEVFSEGQYPGPFTVFAWPFDISASDLVFQFVRPVMFVFPGPPLPEGSKAIQDCLQTSCSHCDKCSLPVKLLRTELMSVPATSDRSIVCSGLVTAILSFADLAFG
jgi:hypothetical protein